MFAEDKLAIHELLCRFNYAIDYGTAEEWADTFTADGSFYTDVSGQRTGRDSLLSWVHELRSRSDLAAFRNCQHWNGNVSVDLDADKNRATVLSTAMVLLPGDPHPSVAMFGLQRDVVVRVGECWLFAAREFRTQGSIGESLYT